MTKLLLFGLSIYLLAGLFIYVYQRQLIYVPPGNIPSSELLKTQGFKYWPAERDYRGLGAGVAAAAIAALKNANSELTITGLVLQVPFDSMPNVAQHHYPVFPARWLIKDQYNNAGNLSDYGGNRTKLLGGKDTVVPMKFGKQLYESLSSKKRLWLFEESGHMIPMESIKASLDDIASFISQ